MTVFEAHRHPQREHGDFFSTIDSGFEDSSWPPTEPPSKRQLKIALTALHIGQTQTRAHLEWATMYVLC